MGNKQQTFKYVQPTDKLCVQCVQQQKMDTKITFLNADIVDETKVITLYFTCENGHLFSFYCNEKYFEMFKIRHVAKLIQEKEEKEEKNKEFIT